MGPYKLTSIVLRGGLGGAPAARGFAILIVSATPAFAATTPLIQTLFGRAVPKSTRPNFSFAVSNKFKRSSYLLASHLTKIQSFPRLEATASPPLTFKSPITTFQPAFFEMSSLAQAAPMPEAPPVTIPCGQNSVGERTYDRHD